MGYWQTRQEAIYKAGEMQVNQYYAKLEKAFNQTRRELQKTIEAFYFEYAEENGLSYAAAQRQLSMAEIGNLRDFIDLAMENIGKYNQTVNNMSIKARITRYQALETQVDAMLRQLWRRAGVEGVHPHRFRRTIATDLLSRGMPIEQVKEFLGHEKLDTTMIYCTVKTESVQASHRKYA